VIYFAQEDSGHIKIGYTEGEPEARIKSLQTGSPTPITLLLAIEGDRAAENGLHQRFSKHRLCGEWFKPSPEIVSYIISQSASLGAAKAFQSAATSRPHTASPWPLKIYLAGKISDSSWRNALKENTKGPRKIAKGLVRNYFRLFSTENGPSSNGPSSPFTHTSAPTSFPTVRVIVTIRATAVVRVILFLEKIITAPDFRGSRQIFLKTSFHEAT
jgi:hypothetical protein